MVKLKVARWTLGVLVIGLLVACGHGADSARGGKAAPAQSSVAGGVGATAAEDADMVSAVTGSSAVTPVNLKFKLRGPPRVGQPMHLELALAQEAGLDIDSILVSLQPGDGLLLNSDRTIAFHSPASGATQHMDVIVQAQQPGLLSLAATVLVDAGSSSLSRSFSIPLIAVPAAQ